MPKPDFERRTLAAEKTVEVLKRKVRELYSGGARTPIQRALEKANEREERNRRRREVAKVREAELRKYSQHLEREVERRTRAIQTVLDNVTFGFLVIGRDLTVREGFTRSCAGLFGRPPEVGEDIGELLAVAGSNRHVELQLSADQVFEDLLPEEVSLDQVAKRYEVDGRVLHVDTRTVRDAAGAVEALLLTVSDITELEIARQQSRVRDVLIGILQQKPAFQRFISEARSGLSEDAETVRDETLLRRIVHTVKGNAASWGLESIVTLAHDIESLETVDGAALGQLADGLRDFLTRHHKVLGVDYELTDGAYAVAPFQLERLRRAAQNSDTSEVRSWVNEVVLRPVHELLGPLPNFVDGLASRLGKDVEFALEGEDVLVDAEVMGPVLRNLPHLIRNAIDHGIEPSWERGEKAPRGTLRVAIAEDAKDWSIRVEDDGRGVPVEEVGRCALSLGLVDEETLGRMSESERLQLVFMEGVSSATETTDISGRGVGMPSVKAAVRARIGSVELVSGSGGTSITMRIPKMEAAVAPARALDASTVGAAV